MHFHDECLTHQEVPGNKQNRMDTLRAHLQDNGHTDVLDGQLLLKADIEGAEWAVLASLDKRVLRKFRQIVLELHYPFLNELTDASRLAKRAKAISNLLQDFHVVHVHPSNLCQPAGTCVEVTFANRAFISTKTGGCHRPERHPLDAPSNPNAEDVDLATLFAYDEY